MGHDAITSVGEGTQTIIAAGDVPVGGTVTQISSGANHTCALLTTGAVRCWGQGTDGQLGYDATDNIGDGGAGGTIIANGDVPVGGTVTQIAAGRPHTCALLDNQALRCWGLGTNGQLGQNATDDIGDGGAGGTIIGNGDVPVF